MVMQLHVEYDFDFQLIAISCFEKDFRLCWNINHALGLELSREEDFILPQKEGNSVHSIFRCSSENDLTLFSLVKNRSEFGVILPEYAQVDYLLKIEDYPYDDYQFANEIRKIDVVNTAFMIEASKLKSKDNLIFD